MRGLFNLVLVIVSAIFATGCATSKLTRLDDVSANEAVVIAKFHCVYNGKDVTKGCNVIFDPMPSFGTPKYQYILDESGYVFAKLPVGANAIRVVIHKSGLMQHHFTSEELTCQINGGGVINYIGDVTFDWKGMSSGAGVGVVALTGVIGSSELTGGGVAVSVESNAAAAQEAFRQKFPNDRSLTPSLLVVKLRK